MGQTDVAGGPTRQGLDRPVAPAIPIDVTDGADMRPLDITEKRINVAAAHASEPGGTGSEARLPELAIRARQTRLRLSHLSAHRQRLHLH